MPNPPQHGDRVASRFARPFRRRKNALHSCKLGLYLLLKIGSFGTSAAEETGAGKKLARAIGTTSILMQSTTNNLTHQYTQDHFQKKRSIFMTGRPDAFVFTQARQSQNNHSIRVNICAVNHSWPRHRPRIRCNYITNPPPMI